MKGVANLRGCDVSTWIVFHCSSSESQKEIPNKTISHNYKQTSLAYKVLMELISQPSTTNIACNKKYWDAYDSDDIIFFLKIICSCLACAVFCFITSSLVVDYIRRLNEADWLKRTDFSCGNLISSAVSYTTTYLHIKPKMFF